MKKEIEYINSIIDDKDTVVVAVSGGADSMCLLHLLLEVRKSKDIRIICAHVNHNVRIESIDEKRFVEDYCKKNDVIFESMTIEKYSNDNFENEARTKRYNYFNELVNEYNARYLFTAHHGDDLIETIMMRIVRGSTLKGYSGFSKVLNMGNYKIVRPLITTTKDLIYEYCNNNDISFVEDPSNKKSVYTRNRYRKRILPFLKKEDANVHEKFLKFHDTLVEYNSYIDKQISNVFEEIYVDEALDLDMFNKLDIFIQKKILYYILEHIYQDDLMLIYDNHVKLIMDLISSNKPNALVYLPGGIKAVKTYNKLMILKEELATEDYEIEFNGSVNLPNGKNIESIDSSDINDNNICRLNLSDIKLPLYIRNKRNGDKIDIKGLDGSKKIKDIFINSKISVSERELWPILVDATGKVLWLPGLKKSKLDIPKKEKCDIILRYY